MTAGRCTTAPMKAIVDPTNALARGLKDIRTQFKVPASFPPDVIAAAQAAAKRAPTQHVDRTTLPFVTLDPASSTDLDQAFFIEASGSDLLLRYAIADVAWFVADGDVVDREAWNRGTTFYLPGGKASLYPEVLSQDAASLLPDGPRPAVIFTVRVDGNGLVKLDGAERALIRSKAKLTYDSVKPDDLPAGFAELAKRIFAAEDRRGASRVDPPEQEVEAVGKGKFQLAFRPSCFRKSRTRRCRWPPTWRWRMRWRRITRGCSASWTLPTRARLPGCATRPRRSASTGLTLST